MNDKPKFASRQKTQNIVEMYNLKSNENIIMLDIKDYQQSTDITCGPATVMSVLNYYDILSDDEMNKQTELRLASKMDTGNIYGTRASEIAQSLKQYSLNIEEGVGGTIDAIVKNLEKGIPTLVNWFDWGGHWALVVGYQKLADSTAEDKDLIFLIDPATHHTNIKSPYGLTILNPNKFQQMWVDSELVAGIFVVAYPTLNT